MTQKLESALASPLLAVRFDSAYLEFSLCVTFPKDRYFAAPPSVRSSKNEAKEIFNRSIKNNYIFYEGFLKEV